MKNIFENAYFGKFYKMRNGHKAIYVTDKHFVKNKHSHTLVFENGDIELYSDDGCICFGGYGLDIVSEWQEEINEEELNKLAEQANPYPSFDKSDMCVAHSHDGFNEGFIEGYRKAK